MANSPYILVYKDPLLTYLLVSVPSILTFRYDETNHRHPRPHRVLPVWWSWSSSTSKHKIVVKMQQTKQQTKSSNKQSHIYVCIYTYSHKHILAQPMDPGSKSLNFIFPTQYVIPNSLNFNHWPSTCVYIYIYVAYIYTYTYILLFTNIIPS